MKLNSKLLILAVALALVLPLMMAGSANAYIGQTQCLKCHEPVSHPGSADKVSFLQTGHSNMLRKVTPGVELYGPNMMPYSADFDWTAGTYKGDPLYYIWDGWIGLSDPRTAVEGGSYTCGSCHTTGYSPNPPAVSGLPNPPADVLSHITVTGSWAFDGIQCERCHGEATYDENAVTDGSTALDETFLKYRQRLAGATDSNLDGSYCDSADRTEVTMYSNDYASQLGTIAGVNYGSVADANFYDIDGNLLTVVTTIGDAPGLACDHPRPRGVHHGGTYNSTTASSVYVPEDNAATNALCGECHQGSHANGFLNSPHARFSGTWAELDDPTKYDTHFSSRLGCAGCHDVHNSLVVTGQKPFYAECGISCHDPASAYGTPRVGFHDQLTGDAPSTVSTAGACKDLAYDNQTDCETNGSTWFAAGTAGSNAEACMICHMEGSGTHLFRINTDANYSYEIDVTTADGAAECVAQGGHVASSHGALSCLDATGAHMGRFSPEGDFAEAEWNDLGQVCLQCHGDGGVATKKFTTKAAASGISGNYHEMPTEFTATTTADCTACHADKADSFAQTGHANAARLVPEDFNITGPGGATLECGHDGFYNVADGKCYTELGGAGDVLYGGLTVTFFHHSWFEGTDDGGTIVSGARPVVSGATGSVNGFNCAPCHTTGFKGDNTGPITAAGLGITVGSNSSYLVTPIDVTSGASWDEFGVQCANCHGKNTEADTHTASMPTTAPETNAVCGKCHLQKHHTNSYLNGPHGGFTLEKTGYATLAEIADPANYDPDNHFSSNRNGCAGCHNVHATTIEAAGGGDAAFNNQCGINCHKSRATTPMAHTYASGTPFDTDMYKSACVVCHMPGNYRTDHLFQISTDAGYARSTNPVPGAGQMFVTVDEACGQCHGGSSTATMNGAPYYTKAQLAAYAVGIHNDSSVNANFNLSYGGNNATASVSAVATGVTCDYNWGDGSEHGTACADTHTYATGGQKQITLTVTSGEETGAKAKVFTAVVPTPPTASADETWNGGTWTEQLVDTSTANGGNTLTSIKVSWGDGAGTTGVPGGTFTHTYTRAGVFSITLTAKDNTGQTGTAMFVAMPSNPVITGNVYKQNGTTGIGYAYVLVTRTYNGRTYTYYAVTNSAGHYQFSTLYPGVYSNLRVTKAGYSFTPIASPATDGSPNNFTAN
jgi:hypothetical protein